MSIPPIPQGYHSIQAYLVVREADRALAFYQKLFDATELTRMIQPGTEKIMHAELRIGDSVLMLAEESEAWGVFSPVKYGGSPVSLMHYVPDVDTTFDKASAAKCEILMPPTDMFWGDRFCKFKDPFGHVWGVATHKFDPTPEQLAAGAQQFAG